MRRRELLLVTCFFLGWPAVLYATAATSVCVQLPADADPVVRNIAAIFARQVVGRCNATVQTAGDAPLVVQLEIEPGIGPEGYKIADGERGCVRISGNDNLGLLYGVGRFLRSSRYDQGGFTPGAWRGASVPKCSFRTIYAATHFMNFYEAAPAEEVQRYIEDLGLWGANAVIVGFPTWQFQGFDDPKAKRNLVQICRILQAGRAVGMKVGLILCANQGFATAPAETRAQKYPDDLHRRGSLGVNCCPSVPAGHAYLMNLYGHLYGELKDIGLDLLIFWPYDEGGCGCQQCWPWGARGFPRMARDLTLLARKDNPHLQAVLSTWVYDTPPADEWAGLARFLATDKSWLNYIMADAHGDFPRYPLEHGVPGNLPLVNFPEISMWGRGPWGAYGANPLPARLDRLWGQTQGKLAGGMPYSEGIYEDINKAICFRYYWNGQAAEETIKEYAAFEYSPAVVEKTLDLVRLLEKNWTHAGPECHAAHRLAAAIEQKLTPQAKQAWRWRILYLRTVIDSEKYAHHSKLEGQTLKQAFAELRRIYHAEEAHPNVRPPMIE